MGGEDDAKLVSAAIAGEEDAFRLLVERYAPMVTAVLYGVTSDAEVSRDLAQDVFVEAYVSLRRLRSGAKFAGWTASIARLKGISWLRNMARRKEVRGTQVDLSAWRGPTPSESTEQAETRSRVLEAVRGLPAGYREVVVLRCMEGQTPGDICKALGISLAAMDKRLSRAKTMLRDALADLSGREGASDVE